MGGLNDNLVIALYAETSKKDPLGEDFCGFGTHLVCLAAVWNGVMTPLPGLGGDNSTTMGINQSGEIAGFAENSTHDSTCGAPSQVLDFEAVLWSPTGQVQELPPLPGDTVGMALALNNNGQVVGSTGTCANTIPNGLVIGPHAVLWENGSPIALGSLGGTMVGVAAGINDAGEVIGGADLASEIPGFPGVQVHGFVWTAAKGMADIGTLGTDFSSVPTSINNKGEVVGGSCDDMGNCRAFLWQNNAMTDLNTLIPADSPLYLVLPWAVNDAGQIVGMGVVNSTGDVHAFIATPSEEPGTAAAAPAMAGVTRPMPIPEGSRKLVRKWLGMRGW